MKKLKKLRKLTISNMLSIFRLLVSPLIFYLILNSYNNLLIGFLYIVALSTDFLDGLTARKFRQKTRMGEVLDPVADKTFLGFVLLGIFIKNRIMIGIYILSIAIILYLIFYPYFVKNKAKVSYFGKGLMAAESLIIFIILIGYNYHWIFIILGLLFLIQGIHYIPFIIEKRQEKQTINR